MKQYLKYDPWSIIEEGFYPEYNRVSESVFSLGNGRMGQRGNFEEKYSGETLLGNYVAGVYYPDKTRVGWWKNGYPEYFAKVLNAANWIGIDVQIDGEELDLATAEVSSFKRELNMREGYLERSFTAKLPSGKVIEVYTKRINSIVDDETGALTYQIKAVNFSGKIQLTPYVDFDIMNSDSNYDEKFWNEVNRSVAQGEIFLTASTKKTDFHVCTGTAIKVNIDGEEQPINGEIVEREKYGANVLEYSVSEGQTLTIEKYGANISSENYPKPEVAKEARAHVARIVAKGFDQLVSEQAEAWAQKWEWSDIEIKGDVAAQQAIRFNIFHLFQTYTGEDERLNIGPKGFTGEKYGGSTYWDTEAYCLPFYLATADQKVSRNLLVYRFKHLQKAIENAEKLGFTDGAALYPMVTINGEECHNEWEITFEEIHRNGAIAYAIWDYINYTGDDSYLAQHGFEVLVGISRFWAQRVHWSTQKDQYVMHGVTGPNEFDNNVNNNWYTSLLAQWTMKYTIEAMNHIKQTDAARYNELVSVLNFDESAETEKWQHIIDKIYLGYDEKLGIFLQQDGMLDKEQLTVADLDPKERPIVEHWSWDRILRSIYIKQADVLQGMYMFEDDFTTEELQRNYDYYEPRTVHESSLSPCIHNIIAAKLGDEKRAYEFYLRTARLDLDDYNNDSRDGLHITSMAGTWMSVIKGFGGMRVRNGEPYFAPFIPSKWEGYSFRINFRGRTLKIVVDQSAIQIENQKGEDLALYVHDKPYTAKAGETLKIELSIPA